MSLLVLRGGLRRVEHVLLALSAVFVGYLIAGVLAHPDWGAAAKGLVIPGMPLTRDAILVVVATIGTTLAPWGLAFIQSYAVDKRLTLADLRLERVDVIAGATLTGVIGAFIVIACAATLHQTGSSVDSAADAARALEPLAGSLASALFATGLLGAALLAASVLPLSTAYSVCEAVGAEAGLDDSWRDARLFYLSFGAVIGVAALIVLIPGAPLISILFLTQALNAVLLLPLLWFIRGIARDRGLMGEAAVGRAGAAALGGGARPRSPSRSSCCSGSRCEGPGAHRSQIASSSRCVKRSAALTRVPRRPSRIARASASAPIPARPPVPPRSGTPPRPSGPIEPSANDIARSCWADDVAEVARLRRPPGGLHRGHVGEHQQRVGAEALARAARPRGPCR